MFDDEDDHHCQVCGDIIALDLLIQGSHTCELHIETDDQ